MDGMCIMFATSLIIYLFSAVIRTRLFDLFTPYGSVVMSYNLPDCFIVYRISNSSLLFYIYSDLVTPYYITEHYER